MKVSSPVGDFPFEARRLRADRGGLVVEGAMGAWPATIRVSPSDVPMLLRLLGRPLMVGGALIGIATVVRGLARRR